MARHRDDDDPAAAEETLLVDREAEAETIIVDREATEETQTVDRDTAEETQTVDREAAEETVVVDRADRTVVVDRGAAPDATVAVTRERKPKNPAAPSALPSTGRRRRGMTMPPVAPGFGRGAVDAVGPGAVATYEPRPLPGPPPESLDLGGVTATRVDSPGMPSVQRRARRTGMIALAAFAVACVVSVVGLIALGFAVLG